MPAPDSPTGLAGTTGTLLQQYDALLVDLDGVVYLADQPVPGAPVALAAARAAGVGVSFVTNNASRTPEEVARHLEGVGVTAEPQEVMTAAVATAGVLAERLSPGTPVLVVGSDGLAAAINAVGLAPVRSAADGPAAVVQGWGPKVDWGQLAEAAVAIRAGAMWLATNTDRTLPSPRGPLPGNGSLVAALSTATDQQPESVGKPNRALFDAALAARPATHPLVVGDRLETDIAGAWSASLPSLLVLSGVSGVDAAVRAPAGQRPTHLGRDIGAVDLAHPAAVVDDGGARCGGARVRLADGGVVVEATDQPATADGLDPFRALCVLSWSGGVGADQVDGALAQLDVEQR